MRSAGRRRLLVVLLILHLVLALASFLTMDLDLDRGPLRDAMDALVDGYEWLGLGVFPVGLLVPVAVLGALWAAVGRPARDQEGGSPRSSA